MKTPRHDLPLQARREALILRIHAARAETAVLAGRLAGDVRRTQRARSFLHSGFSLARSALVAAGVLWSFKASAHSGFVTRFFTMAVSTLSAIRTFRALGKVGDVLSPFSTTSQKQT